HQDAVWASLPRGNCGVDGRSFTCYECPKARPIDTTQELTYNKIRFTPWARTFNRLSAMRANPARAPRHQIVSVVQNRKVVTMLEPFYFALGLANNALLIWVFLIRKKHFALLQKTGWVYLLLAIPAIYAMFLVQQEQKSWRYTVFLGIFLAFLALEALYDWILKISFRETMNWKQLAPYVALYISMNYGFVVMVWRYDSAIRGILMLALFVIQIVANLISHPRPAKGDTGRI
ncbi:MAG: hypothetical protein JW892_07950, partial [Anaerolineae bacterium]|nr:hypothetical protein [Anaerolineae bacterium]